MRAQEQFPGAIAAKFLDDGRAIVVYQMIFTARVCIGPDDSQTYDDAWCYDNVAQACEAVLEWDGNGDPPDGWHRHIGSGRRRPGGDPEKEYVEA